MYELFLAFTSRDVYILLYLPAVRTVVMDDWHLSKMQPCPFLLPSPWYPLGQAGTSVVTHTIATNM